MTDVLDRCLGRCSGPVFWADALGQCSWPMLYFSSTLLGRFSMGVAMSSVTVELRNVAGTEAALGWAGAHTIVVDPEARAGGRGLGLNGAQLLALSIGGCFCNDLPYVAAGGATSRQKTAMNTTRSANRPRTVRRRDTPPPSPRISAMALPVCEPGRSRRSMCCTASAKATIVTRDRQLSGSGDGQAYHRGIWQASRCPSEIFGRP